MKWYELLMVLVVMAVCGSCKKASMPPVQYMKWVETEGHGFLQRQETHDFSYAFLYKPKPYIVLKQEPNAAIGQRAFESVGNNFDNLNYASIWLESLGGRDLLKGDRPSPEELERRTHYLAFNVQQDMMLVEGADTLKCVFAHWERDGLGNRQHLILAFQASRDSVSIAKKFIFNNRLMNHETVRFTILRKDLDKIPNIQF